MDLILKSINCEKYKEKFDEHSINENTFLYLTANDLRTMDLDNNDIPKVLEVINILNKMITGPTDVKLS